MLKTEDKQDPFVGLTPQTQISVALVVMLVTMCGTVFLATVGLSLVELVIDGVIVLTDRFSQLLRGHANPFISAPIAVVKSYLMVLALAVFSQAWRSAPALKGGRLSRALPSFRVWRIILPLMSGTCTVLMIDAHSAPSFGEATGLSLFMSTWVGLLWCAILQAAGEHVYNAATRHPEARRVQSYIWWMPIPLVVAGASAENVGLLLGLWVATGLLNSMSQSEPLDQPQLASGLNGQLGQSQAPAPNRLRKFQV